MDPLRESPLALALSALLSVSLHVGVFAVARAPGARHQSGVARAFEPISPPIVGETLEVEPAEQPGAEATAVPEPPREPPSPLTPGATASPPRTAAFSAGRTHPASASDAPPSGTGRPALFGAVGVRYATDLATTFTRGFPQAASADPVWGSVPIGSAGTADVTLTLDESGHLVGSTVAGAPSSALRRGIERTLALLGPRAFTARGAATRLRVTAHVGRDDVHDGLHGDVFALSGGSFTGDVGTAFFALPGAPGRRIDVELRLLP